MLQKLLFRQKVLLLIASTVIGFILIAVLSIIRTREDIIEGRKASLRTAAQSELSIVRGFQAAAAAGKMSEDAAKAAAVDAVRLARYNLDKPKPDYFFILKTDGTGVMHPFIRTWNEHQSTFGTVNKQGVDTAKAMVEAVAAHPGEDAVWLSVMVARNGDQSPDATLYPKLQYLNRVSGWDWIVGSGLYMDDVEPLVLDAALRQLALCLAVLTAVGGLGYVVTRSVIRQIGGEPSLAIEVMKRVARGDLTVDVPAAAPGSMVDGLARMVVSMRETVSQVRRTTDSVTTASSEIAAGNNDLSVRTEQTAANLQRAASSLEQLTGAVRQSADSARQANQLAASAAEVAGRGGAVVSQVVSTMVEIDNSSKKIADIIGVIDGIAFQTNILALNAAVEAARAGEQGRGFAVVASEVRSLAQRSAGAAKEIKSLIGSSVERVAAGTRLVADAGMTMQEIVASVQRVSDVIGEITVATTEQSQGIEQVNQAVTELDQMTQQNAALVEESAAAAGSLESQAATLVRAVSSFQIAG